MMKKLSFNPIRKAITAIIGLMITIIFMISVIAFHVTRFNQQDQIQTIGDTSGNENIEVTAEIGEGWEKVMPADFVYPEEFSPDSFQVFNQNGDNTSYGRTCEFQITNYSNLIIRDWKLIIPVKSDLYVNKAWNGTIEFSQFGGKNKDTFNPMKVTKDQVAIESVEVDELLLFPMRSGDVLTYYPSSDFYEYPLSASSPSSGNLVSTKIGIIFYTEDTAIDLSEVYLIYHFGKKLTDVPLFLILSVLLVVLAFLLLVFGLELIIGNRYLMIQKAADEKAQKELGAALLAAEEANNAKTAFLNNMSHDIRTPMNAIIGFTDLLEKNLDDKEKAKDYLKKIKSSNEFLLSLINNVLEMARIESGKTLLYNDYCNAPDLFQEIANVFSEQMKEKNIEFTYSIDLKHENILCDKTKVREIYLNILSNSLKYTNSGGKVNFSISEEKADIDHHVIYKVIFSDTGIGMSKEYLEMIYDQFSRERSTTEAGISGTGLGMTIVKKLVDLMKGSIHIESELGKGTRIWIRIPFEIAKESQKEINEVSSFDKKPLSFTGKRILLAEDNDLNAEIAIELLHESGFYVEHAHDGVECIDMLKAAASDYYDGILMDIQMPNLNGYEATEYIRKMDDLKKAHIPIIAMTANAFIEDVQKCLDAGMNAHIAKPISIDEVIKTLGKYL